MQIKLKKSGNSRVLPIPPAILQLLHLDDDSVFEVKTDGSKLIINSVHSERLSFEAAHKKVVTERAGLFASLANK